MKLIEGELLDYTEENRGQSSRRMSQVWTDVRAALEAKLKTFTLDKLSAGTPDEMYYI